MRIDDEAYRQFQRELAELDRQQQQLSVDELNQLTFEQKQLLAKTEFLRIKRKYWLTVDDVVSFFPEEESIAYLQSLMTA